MSDTVTMKSKRKHVYKIGDKIRILRPRVVERVGYPKTVHDYLPEVTREMRIAERLLRGISLEDAIKQEASSIFSKANTKVHPKVEWAAAYLRAKDDGFGGRERSIHYSTLSYWPGCRYSQASHDNGWTLDTSSFKPIESEVLGKRVVKTGKYFASHSWYDSYTGEYEYEPGGLEDMKTHVIIRTPDGEFHTDDIEPVKETNEQRTK